MTSAVKTAVAHERAGAAPRRGLAERRRQGATTHSARRPVAAQVAPGSEPSTLEDALLGAWEDLASRGRAECLVCGAGMKHGPTGGDCAGCGSALS